MTHETARRHLKRMLKSFTAGSILHLLAKVFEEMAKEASEAGDETRIEQYRVVATSLFVTGLGIDAACPR